MRSPCALSMLFSMLIGTALTGAHFAAGANLFADKSSFDPALVAQGAQLAAIGGCDACHTRPGGKPFAGGLALRTAFGTIYSTNITPDSDTGIGAWTDADFLRAMHEGVDRGGRNLYPAFPYDHFTRVTDSDVKAIYAYIVTPDPVRAVTPPNELAFPMQLRSLLTGWKLLYFEPGAYRNDPGKSAQWNRGAYLVEGLGHCGACHTPRNALGAERKDEYLAGGDAEGWHSPALNARSPAPTAWTADQIFKYLRQGWDEGHGTAAGPMRRVVHDLSEVAEQDVRAMAQYLVSVMGSRVGERVTPPRGAQDGSDDQGSLGASIYAGACAACH